MKIGLIDVDSKYPNLALMKLSAYHKAQGDLVEWFKPIMEFSYDKIYASKVFSFSNLRYFPQRTIKGGYAFNNSQLDPEIEHCYPDYELYKINYSMGYLTRGCINNCPFCIIPSKEGDLRKVSELEEFWNNQEKLMLLDNCLTDYIHADHELVKIRDLGIRLDLTQGFNIRTIKPNIARILSEIKLWDKNKQWRFAWDNPKDEKRILNGIQILNQAGIKNWKMMCYVLVGYNTSKKQDLHRINVLDQLGLDPFVMPYVKNDYTSKLARWCNRKPLMKSCSFEEYVLT